MSVELHVLVFDRQIIDPALGRRNPGGHLSGLAHLLHERVDERPVRLGRDPFRQAPVVFVARNEPAFRADRLLGPGTDGTAEARGGSG